MNRALVFLVAGALSACSGPPGGPPPFEWHPDLQDMPDAVLSVWQAPQGDRVVAVGGSVGAGMVLEWQAGDTAWDAPLLPSGAGLLWWVWSAPDGATFVVGENATVLTSGAGGGVWTQAPLDGVIDPRVVFYGVWGASADQVWVVGGSFNPGVPPSAILHWDGLVWTAEDVSGLPPSAIFKVWGTSADDVWAVGTDGLIAHRGADGVWRQVDSGTTQRLIAVMGRSPSDVYAVGGDGSGVVLRWDGVGWTEFAQAGEPLSAVWTAPGRALYVGGNRGFLARYGGSDGGDPAPDRFDTTRPTLEVDFHCLGGSDARVVAVGADLLGGGAQHWNGAVWVYGGTLPEAVDRPPRPDAAPPDAPPPDALIIDGAPDALPPDAHWPAEGELCGFLPTDAGFPEPYCAGSLVCWELKTSAAFICTEECVDASECTAYGPGACCKRPGFQTLTTVCIPGSYIECSL